MVLVLPAESLCVDLTKRGLFSSGNFLSGGGSNPIFDQLSSPRRRSYKLEQVQILIRDRARVGPAHPVDDLFPRDARPKQQEGYPRHAARLDQG